MATDLERLTVSLEANVKKFERELARARGVAIKALDDVEREAARRENAIGAAFGGLAKRAMSALAAGFSLNEIRKAADEYIGIVNTLRTAGVGQGQIATVFDQLFAAAQRNAVPLDALAQLYGRVSQAQTTLNASSQELLGLTDIVAQSLRASGTSATEASGALLQLGQALSGGKVQAEEYNSLLDGMYPLLQAAAAGLLEAGGDVAKLTLLVKDGKVSSEAFFRAIQAGAPLLEQKLSGSVLTTQQAMTRLNNEFVKAVGEFDKATGASQVLAGAINALASNIGGVGQAAAFAVNGVQALIGKVGELAKANAAMQRQQALTYQQERAARVAEAREMALANAGGRASLAQERADQNEAAAAASRKALADFRASEAEFANALREAPLPPGRPASLTPGAKPVSLKDFAVPGDKSDGGSAAAADRDRVTAIERYIIALQKSGELAKAELETTGKSNIERDKARALVEATAAAQKDYAAGLRETAQLTAGEREKILGIAEATAQWNEEARRLKESLDFASDVTKDAFKGLISDLKAGKTAIESLSNAFDRMATKMADKAIDNLVDGLFKSGGSGVSGVFGAVGKLIGFADGGRVRGPGNGRSDSILAWLSNGEHVTNARSARKYAPLLDAINRDRLPAFAKGGFASPIIHRVGANSSARRSAEAAITVNLNVTSPDAGSFRRSHGQIVAEIAAGVERGRRLL